MKAGGSSTIRSRERREAGEVSILQRFLEARAVKRLLKTQGFIVFCQCGKALNLNPVVESEGTHYTWRCPICGKKSTFNLDFPVPVKVDLK